MNPSENKINTNNENQPEPKIITNKNINKESKEINQQEKPEIINQIFLQNQTNTIKNPPNYISQSQFNQETPNINSLIPSSHPSSSKLNLTEFDNEKGEFERTKKYINYLKTHLDSSYYAFNEIKNKNNILITKSKNLENEIKKNNLIYQKLIKSIQEKTKENSNYKEKYEKILEEKKKKKKEKNKKKKEKKKKKKKKKKNFGDGGCFPIDKKIEKLKEKNLILTKENKSKEEIISNLKKTLEILEKNKNDKSKEKKERLNELKEEKNSIEKLKIEFAEMGKELTDKLKELEKTKQTMLYLIEQKNKNLEENENLEQEEEKEENEIKQDDNKKSEITQKK